MKFIFFVLSMLFFNSSFAFTLTGTNPNLKGWANSNVEFRVNDANCPAGVDVEGIIRDAVEVWNNVPTSSIKASYAGTTSSTTYANPTTVYCETNFLSVVGAPEDSVPGAANSHTTADGEIKEGILYLNASSGQANIANFNRTLLTIILAHEIGHVLGLGHSADTQALMYYDGSAKKTLSLGQDDIDGISYLYPSDELKDKKYAGCGLVKTLPPPDKGNFALLLFFLMLPLAVWTKLVYGKSSQMASTS